MKPSALVATSLWMGSSAAAALRFRQALCQPGHAQEQVLARLLRANARSQFASRYGLAGTDTYRTFASKTPLMESRELDPWVTRIIAGEPSVLTEEPVTHLIPTSGTSGAVKLIPFTRSLQREFSAAIGPWLWELALQRPGLLMGPAYWSVTPGVALQAYHGSKVPVGFEEDTHYLGGALQRILSWAMAAPSSLRHVPDLASFRHILLLHLLHELELRLISVWHPSFLTLLLDDLEERWELLLQDLAQGTLSVDLPAALRHRLRLRPDPQRSLSLARLQSRDLARIWPRLAVVSSWGDAHAGLGFEDLRRRFPLVLVESKGLLATEGVVSVPFGGLHPAALTSHFFEFFDQTGGVRQLHELEKDQVYEPIMTTGGGLWRYRIGDQVHVDGFVGRTPSFRFVGRTGGGSDRFGEKLSEEFCAHVIRILSPRLRSLRFAMFAPDEDQGRVSYTLFVEAAELELSPEIVDQALSENPQYSVCRRLGQLFPARIFTIRKDGYSDYAHFEMRRGARLGDIKPRALSPEAGWRSRFTGAYRPLQTSVVSRPDNLLA